MKNNFIVELLGGIGSRISSRRTSMVFFILLFAFCLILNIFTGKEPSQQFHDELFHLTVLSLVLVFGDIVLKVLAFFKGKQIDPPTPPTPGDPAK
jgi:preprotein translocase subunit SecG